MFFALLLLEHVPKAIRQKTSQPTRTQPNRKCKAKSKTQFEPESDSAIGQHLLESNQCARNYSDSQFKILTTGRSQFHLSLLEAVYISRIKPDLCRHIPNQTEIATEEFCSKSLLRKQNEIDFIESHFQSSM